MLVAGCSSPPAGPGAGGPTTPSRSTAGGPSASAPSVAPSTPPRAFAPGNPAGRAAVPPEARAVDTSRPTRVIGTGSAASCTSAAVVAAVAAGGIIRFNCGPEPVTIAMQATAKVVNAHGPTIVLDGGGLVTLSGGGRRRILYM